MSINEPQTIGFWTCVALVVGNTIGSGIFLLPAALAPYGASSIFAWIFTAAGAMTLAVVFSQLSRAFPYAGGPYAYTQEAFGPFLAFIVAWGYWISIWVGNAAIATGAVSYLMPLFPGLKTIPFAPAVLILAIVWILTFVNRLGIRASGRVQNITTIIKLAPLLAIALYGILLMPGANFTLDRSTPVTLNGITAAATLTLWALLGLESATIPADKVRDPARTIPRATLLGTSITALICMVSCSVVMLVLPPDKLAASNAPFADAARLFWGPHAAQAVALLAAISGFGALNGWILLQAEMPSVMARHGVFPLIFARENSRGTPGFALVFTSAMVSALIIMNYQSSLVDVFTFMILLSTTACLVMYTINALALLKLQWKGSLGEARKGSTTLAVIAILAAAYSLWTIIGAGARAVIWGFILLLLGVPIYLLMRRPAT